MERQAGSAGEVFLAFIRLGFTAFGGPVAHLGYFRDEFVIRRRWIDEAGYADLVALCQFLPGPASSQVGFALGLLRAGAPGALAAWAGFTLPSALLMLGFAFASADFSSPLGAAFLHGLKLVAVAVVGQAVFGMARALAPDRQRAAIALGALALVTLTGNAAGQLGAILGGALAGAWPCQDAGATGTRMPPLPVSRKAAAACLGIFSGLLLGTPLLAAATGWQGLALFDAFYRSGALVFGGGHVVLPLLRDAVVAPGWMSDARFLAGYGAAQAVPGPLFTVSAYLGASVTPAPNGIAGAVIALIGLFLPGMLILLAALPFWAALRGNPLSRAALAGINASVVGILAAALYDPVWTGAVTSPGDFLLAASGFVALMAWRAPSWLVVIGLVGMACLTRF